MTLSAGPSQFLERCRVQADRFICTIDDSMWRVGAVLLATKDDAFAVVRKAPVEAEDYEFSGLYVLPGGMVRTCDLSDAKIRANAPALALRSLRSRVRKEAGLEIAESCEDPASELGPIVTSYRAKGQPRFTVVVAYRCSIESDLSLRTTDHSVDDVAWMKVPVAWARFAPANTMVIAHLLWPRLDESERRRARPHVEKAAGQCSAWATTLGLPRVPFPWADPRKLGSWRAAWSKI
jgi:hypothetical protein